MTRTALLVVMLVMPRMLQAAEQPEQALFRFWSPSAVYFPLSPCCRSAHYPAGQKARLTVRVYPRGRFGVCSEVFRASFLASLEEDGRLETLREDTISSGREPDCKRSLSALEVDHFGTRPAEVHEEVRNMILPNLVSVFRTASPPAAEIMKRLESTLRSYIANELTLKGKVTITVGRWVKERPQAYAIVRTESAGHILEEGLIIDPRAPESSKLVLGAVVSPPVLRALKRGVLSNSLIVVTGSSTGR